MKARQQQLKPPKVFAPVELTLTFETQEELDRFATGTNYTPILEALFGNMWCYVHEAVERWGCSRYINRDEMIAKLKHDVNHK